MQSATPAQDQAVCALSDELVEALSKHYPTLATIAGLPGHDDRWDDLRPEGAEAARRSLADLRARLERLGGSATPWGRRAARVAADLLDDRLSILEHEEHFLDLNSIDSSFQGLRLVFDLMDPASSEGLSAINTRLATIDRPLADYRELLEEGRRRGHVVARRQVLAVVDQARILASEHSSLDALAAKARRARAGDDGATTRGVAHAKSAFAAFAAYLQDEYLPHASEREAVGRDRYVRAARRFLGMSIDPEEAYAWGWEEFLRIEDEMKTLARDIRGGGSLAQVIHELKEDPELCAHGEDEFLNLIVARQLQAIEDLSGKHFDIPEPIRRIEVKKAPHGSALGAYYVPPSDDFSRPGTIWYAPGERARFPLYDEITTAYHEGFPGHHLQCALAVSLRHELSRLHRLFVMYSGYAEGWALYAEQLMHELGYFERPEFVLGMLQQKLMRALRVAADIGLHLELPIDRRIADHAGATWSHARCIALLTERCFMPRDHAESEATRYLGYPGQAISYKLGERVILELRGEFARRHGPAQDLRAFHKRVLESGSVGLSHLRELVLE